MRNVRVYTNTEIGCQDGFGSYSVQKAVFHNGMGLDEMPGDEINNIEWASFSIRGFSKWYGKSGLEVTCIDNQYFKVKQKKEDIFYVYKGKDFDVIIFFNANYPPITMDGAGNTITLENSPHIGILYHSPVTDIELLAHIRIIYRFFALLIGSLGYIDDIWFRRQGISMPYLYLINEDITYNINSRFGFGYEYRTKFNDIKDKLQELFNNWLSFSSDEIFNFLLHNYFNLYKDKSFIFEDYFLTCCKFIEGYSIRKNGDVDKELIKRLEKEIRPLFQNDKTGKEPTQVKKVLQKISDQMNVKYEAKNISNAVAYALINTKTLESRFKDIELEFFSIISNNQESILGSDYSGKSLNERIVKTRNFYSHFKSDKSDILSIQQMYRCNDILLALITCILLNEIGFSIDEIKEILKHDADFFFLMKI